MGEKEGYLFVFDRRFERDFKHLSADLQDIARDRIKIFRADPFDSRLHAHKLHGKLEVRWAFSVTSSCRIVFHFTDPKTIVLQAIGQHDIYDRL